jgi:hypothetical protein
MFTTVSDPDAPPVPILINFCWPDAVAFVNILAASAPVGVPPSVKDVAAPKVLIVVALVLKALKVELLVSADVLIVGEINV